jgi:hypothetical protein
LVEENKLALRRQQRDIELPPDLLHQLKAGVPAIYTLHGEPVKEYPDGRRFVVRGTDGELSNMHVREVLSKEEQVRIAEFVDSDVAVAKARAFGTDVSQTLRNALLTPEERWRRANEAIAQTRMLFGAARRG